MATITNTSKGPRGVTTVGGETVYLNPGESRDDLELSEGEVKSARATGYFEFGAAAAKKAEKTADKADKAGE